MEERHADSLLRAVAAAAESLPEIQAAFLFRSQASARARTDSDVDVAVLIDTAAAPVNARTRLRRVIEALASRIAADRLDAVILNDAPPALAFQVLKNGKLAFDRDPIALHRFRVRTYAQHSDFESTERSVRSLAGACLPARTMVDADVLRRRIDALHEQSASRRIRDPHAAQCAR